MPCILKNFNISYDKFIKFNIQCCDYGLHKIEVNNSSDHFILNKNKLLIYDFKPHEMNKVILYILNWFKLYFEEGNISTFDPNYICWNLHRHNRFFLETWKILMENVKFGETISYSKLARLTSNPKAIRAVGNAMSKNPYILVVPCHRVVKSDGQIGNYSAGVSLKIGLLKYESSLAFNQKPNKAS